MITPTWPRGIITRVLMILSVVSLLLLCFLCFDQVKAFDHNNNNNSDVPFSGVYSFETRAGSGGRLYLCQKNANEATTVVVQGTYVKSIITKDKQQQEVLVGIVEGTMDKKKKWLRGQFVDAGGVNGQFAWQEQSLGENNGTELVGSLWYLNSKDFSGTKALNIRETKLSNQEATIAQCMSYDFGATKMFNMSGTWTTVDSSGEDATNGNMTWCANQQDSSAVGDIESELNTPAVARAQTFFNGRVWAGVWMHSDSKASFQTKSMGTFLRVITSESVFEAQWYVDDGNYFELSNSAWHMRSVTSYKKTSDDVGTCVSAKNQMPWMGTFDLGKGRLMFVCYDSGSTLRGSISSYNSKLQQLVRGSVYGSLSTNGKSWSGMWYDVTEKKPYHGRFEITLSDDLSQFTGAKWYGTDTNATHVQLDGKKSIYEKTVNFFSNDEQCKLAGSNPFDFEGTWTLNQPDTLDSNMENWAICLDSSKETQFNIPYNSQKQAMNGLTDRNESIAIGTIDTTRVFSVIRRVGNLMESHYWDSSYEGLSINSKIKDIRPSNDSCFAIAKKDNRIALAVALTVPLLVCLLLFVALLVFFLLNRVIMKKKQSQGDRTALLQ